MQLVFVSDMTALRFGRENYVDYWSVDGDYRWVGK